MAHLGGMLAGGIYLRFLRRRMRPLLSGRSWLTAFVGRLGLHSARRDRERLDALLDKVTRYGIHTLTPGERKFLDRVSRRVGHEGPRRWPGRISCRRTAAGRS